MAKKDEELGSFYEKLYPQSAYRKYRPESQVIDQRTTINTELVKLKIKNKKMIDQLREIIRQADEVIIGTLLPEGAHEAAKGDGHLDTIYRELGLGG